MTNETLMYCIKCNSQDYWTAWHKNNYYCSYAYKKQFDGNRVLEDYEEHLHYGCRVCQYEWTGPTADSGEPNFPRWAWFTR